VSHIQQPALLLDNLRGLIFQARRQVMRSVNSVCRELSCIHYACCMYGCIGVRVIMKEALLNTETFALWSAKLAACSTNTSMIICAKNTNDNPIVGIVLCCSKNQSIVRYSVLHESRRLFASKYHPVLQIEIKCEHRNQ
jgi:hypothetical protein